MKLKYTRRIIDVYTKRPHLWASRNSDGTSHFEVGPPQIWIVFEDSMAISPNDPNCDWIVGDEITFTLERKEPT